MSYKIDRVYDTDGTELTNPGHTTTLAGAAQMEHDGRYLWVTCGTNGIGIYEWWGAASDDEPPFEALDDTTYPRYDSGVKKKLRLVTYLTVGASASKRTTKLPSMAEAGATAYPLSTGETAYFKSTARSGNALNAFYIKRLQGKMYVTNGANFREIFVFDINTQSFLTGFNVEETYTGMTTEKFTKGTKYPMNSNLEAVNGKLWMVGSAFGDDYAQKLYLRDVSAGNTSVDILVRPSEARTWIANGQNGSVYISNYNNVSVTKFSDIDGSGQTTIRTNANPTRIAVGPDRRIWVSSYAGMLTLIDYDDDQVHNDYSTTVPVLSLQGDPTNGAWVWFIDQAGLLARHDLNDHSQIEAGFVEDWQFSATKLGQPEVLWISQQMEYESASGETRVLKPYIFLIQDNKLLAWKLDRYLYREAFMEVNGIAAVSMGPQQYFGD